MMGFGSLGEIPLGGDSSPASLVMGTGSFAVSGQPAGLVATHLPLALGAGAFALTGQASGYALDWPFPMASGAFALAGQAAGLSATRQLALDPGAFVWTGVPAILLKAIPLVMSAGSFSLTGVAAGLVRGLLLSAGPGAFAVDGQGLGFLRTYIVPFSTGAFIVTGNLAQLYYQRTIFSGGVSFPSYGDQATYAVTTGAADANYPIANLGDFTSIRTVARASASGAFSFTFTLPAAQAIQLIALLHHNASASETVRVRLFSDNNPDPVGNAGAIVHDTAALPMFPTGSAPSTRYAQVRPIILGVPVTARSGLIDLSANAAAWQIGALEVGGWWNWPDVNVDRSLGVTNSDLVFPQPLDVDHITYGWSGRAVSGERAVVDQSEIHTTALDFQQEKMLWRPFLWMGNYDDPTTWVREAIVVTNASLPAPAANQYPSGQFGFDLAEFMR